MNLNGLRVLNTRPFPQGESLSHAITAAGGVAINFPTLCIEPTSHHWTKDLPSLTTINQAIFISANAVKYFFAKIAHHTWPQTIHNIAIGNASAEALQNQQIRVDQIPEISDSEHLLQLEPLQQPQGQTILLVKGEGGRPTIADTLLSRGTNLISLDVYRRVLPTINPQHLSTLWQDGKVDIILFTSQQSMQNAIELLGADAYDWLCQTTCLVISQRLAETAFSLGIKKIIIGNYDTILETLEHYTKERAQNK